MSLQRMESCKEHHNLAANVQDLKIDEPARNNFMFSGKFIANKEIAGPLELHMRITRCSPDRTGCIPVDEIIFINLCDKIYDGKAFWSELTKHFEPKLKCPLAPGTYNFSNGTIDVSGFSRLPLSGYLWVIHLTIVKIDDKIKKNTIVFCASSDMMITSSRKRTKKTKQTLNN